MRRPTRPSGSALKGSRAHDGMTIRHSDHNPLAGHLDAAAGIGFLLDLLFAIDRRPRPYNTYLAWELDRFPLPGWESAALLETVARIAATGEVALQQRLLARVEAAARGAGHGAVLYAWGEDQSLCGRGWVRCQCPAAECRAWSTIWTASTGRR